ncbi:P protein [Pelomyxa schiedti]|nr:P protein [Pelomyxa schiedti]
MMTWLDWQTIVLLCSMMVTVSIFSETGIFGWLAWHAFKISGRCTWRHASTRRWAVLLLSLSLMFTLSMLLDNCTSILVFGPIAVKTSKLLNTDPLPFLIPIIYCCSLAGATTLVGDPPNLIIGGQFDLGFNDFLANTLPAVLFLIPFAVVITYFQFRTSIKQNAANVEMIELVAVPPTGELNNHEAADKSLNTADATPEPSVSRSTALDSAAIDSEPGSDPMVEDSHSSNSDEGLHHRESAQHFPRSSLDMERPSLELAADHQQSPLLHTIQIPARTPHIEQQIIDLPIAVTASPADSEYSIKSWSKLWKCLAVFSTMVIFFLLESVTHVSTALVACIGAGVLLMLTSPKQIGPVLEHIEWPTIFFFAYLFVFVELVNTLGFMNLIGSWVIMLIQEVPTEYQLPTAMLCVLWLCALVAGWCNNIAFTASFVPLVYHICNSPELALPVRPMAWTLALGVAISANSTIIAAAPNLLVGEIAKEAGHPITFLGFMKRGMVFTLLCTVLLSAYTLTVYWWLGYSG